MLAIRCYPRCTSSGRYLGRRAHPRDRRRHRDRVPCTYASLFERIGSGSGENFVFFKVTLHLRSLLLRPAVLPMHCAHVPMHYAHAGQSTFTCHRPVRHARTGQSSPSPMFHSIPQLGVARAAGVPMCVWPHTCNFGVVLAPAVCVASISPHPVADPRSAFLNNKNNTFAFRALAVQRRWGPTSPSRP